MISNESIERIKAEARLLDLVSETVKLRRSGMHHSGLCPFHSERSPSFHVRETNNTYHCFGCGASGNVISFAMATRAMSFPEAVEFLSQRFGIPLKYEGTKGDRKQQPQVNKEELFAVTKQAHLYFRNGLRRVKGGSGEFKTLAQYIKSRGIKSEAINAFGIGYSPDVWRGLSDLLKEQKISEEKMISAGVIRRSQSGDLFDLFRGRLIFPILLDSRRIVGFGGRIIPGIGNAEKNESAPKYINSPESPIYHKTRTLFGLPQAMQAMRETGEVFLVEGYMDVVGLWQAGVRNVVACCGTAVTEQHLARLKSYVGKIYLLLDGDQAGKNAAAKVFPVSKNVGIDVEVILLSEGQDPDDLARKHGAESANILKALHRHHPIDVYLDSILTKHGCGDNNRPGPNLLGKISEEIVEQLVSIKQLVTQTALIDRAARRLGIDGQLLARMIAEKSGKAAPQVIKPSPVVTSPAPVVSRLSALPLPEKDIIRAVLTLKTSITERILRSPEVTDLLSSETVSFVNSLHSVVGSAGGDPAKEEIAAKRLVAGLGSEWIALYKETAKMVERDKVDMLGSFEHAVKGLKRLRQTKELQELTREMARDGVEADEAKIIYDQIVEVKKVIGQL